MQKILQLQAEQVAKQTQHLREIERHAATDKVVQAAQVYTSYKSLKDSDRMVDEIADLTQVTEEGLLKKTGDGLNSNVIQLTAELRKSIKIQGATLDEQKKTNRVVPKEVRTVDTDKLIERTQIEAQKYQPGGKEYILNKVKEATGVKPTSAKDLGSVLKGAFRVENIFDLSEGKSQGFLGQVLRQHVAKRDYINTEMKAGTIKTREEGEKRFKLANKYRGEMAETTREIERRKSEGAKESDLRREGLFARLEKADRNLGAVDTRYRAKRVRAQDTQKGKEDDKPTPLAPPPYMGRPGETKEESSEETQRLFEHQLKYLAQIEENTRPIIDILEYLRKNKCCILDKNRNKDKCQPCDGRGPRGPGTPGIGQRILQGIGVSAIGALVVGALGSILKKNIPLPTSKPGQVPGEVPTRIPGKEVPLPERAPGPGRVPGPVEVPTPGPTPAPGPAPKPIPPGAPRPGPANDPDYKPGKPVRKPAGGNVLEFPKGKGFGKEAVEEVVERVGRKGAAKFGTKAALMGGATATGPAAPFIDAGITLGFGAYDAYQGYGKAAENLDIKGRAPTFGEKMSSAGGEALSGATFGLLDPKLASRKVQEHGKTALLAGPAAPAVIAAKEVMNYFGLGPKPTPAKKVTAPPPKAADAVTNTSASNAAARDQKAAAAPIVVSAPTTTNVQQTSNYAPKYPARNTDSSIQQYNKERYGY